MTYATAADIVTAYGPDALYVADHDGDGQVSSPAVTRALEGASGEVDSFIAVRYPLPLPVVPVLLRQFAVDIAVYRLAQTADRLTEEIRRRYDDAIAALRRIGEGKQALVLPAVSGEPAAAPTGDPRPIVTSGPPRLFGRATTRGL